MLRRTCTSASFSDPINELSGNTGSNDRDGANKGLAHTGTANTGAASTESASLIAPRTSVENEDTTNRAPVHTETAYIDAATSTNIESEGPTNKGLLDTQIANIATSSTDVDNTDIINTSPANTSIDEIINAVNESMAKAANTSTPKSTARRPWVKKLRKAGHFLIFG